MRVALRVSRRAERIAQALADLPAGDLVGVPVASAFARALVQLEREAAPRSVERGADDTARRCSRALQLGYDVRLS